MKLLELFSGNGDISKAFNKVGFEIFRVDWSDKVEAELHTDIGSLNADGVIALCGGVPEIVWASPDCTTYSIATHRHRTSVDGFLPHTEYATECDRTNTHLWSLIDELVKLGTEYFFVENPRGRYRHMPFVKNRQRYTLTYCSYGRDSMKPTDIFTNHPNPKFKQMCTTNNPPHRHVDWGTGVKRDYLSRGEMPEELCNHIASICL
jgi:hypothetical protein